MFWLLEAKTTSRTQVIMSTFITIKTDKKNEKYIEDGFEIMKSVDMSLSSYNKDAKVFLLNKNLHVSLDAYLYEALSLCKYYYKVSYGYFDITVGSITKDLYRFGEDERVASALELKSAKIDFNALKFNEKEAFIKDGMKVDLGGMGKGFGVQKVADYFKKMQIDDAIISASGDIRCLSTCKIEVQDPFNQDSYLLSFDTLREDMGISTSGNYNRYVITKENNHLIDPKAKKPQTLFASITLIGAMSSASLDAYATAASVMPIERAYQFLDSLDVGYIIVQSDKEVIMSRDIAKYIKNLSNFSK